MDKKILITGALGYLGSRVASAININGRQVVLGISCNNNSLIPKELKHLEIRRYDLSSKESCINLCKDIDIVIHTSGLNSDECFKSPSNAIIVNCLYTANLLEGIKYNNVSKFLYFSTAHVYSSQMDGFINESTNTNNLHPYATSHLSAEKIVSWFGLQNKTITIILRLSNCFGKEIVDDTNCWNLFINNICKQGVFNKIININSNPNIQRNFLPIIELCRIINFFIENYGSKNEIFNIGNIKTNTLEEISSFVQMRFQKILNFKPIIIYNSPAIIIKNHFIYSISKLINIGYFPEDHFKEEIDNLIIYLNNKNNE